MRSKKWWEKSEKKGPVEWLIVLQGMTVDQKARTTPSKHQDAWNPSKPVAGAVEPPVPVMNTMLQQQQQQQQMQMQIQMHAMQMAGSGGNAAGAHVLRHVEQRRGFSPEEAEVKMVEMSGDLFKNGEKSSGKGETREM